MLNRFWIILVLCPLVLGCASCQWHEAEAVVAMADSIDQTQHVIYDDTAALGLVIRQLDNPMGKVFMRSTLGKAYYYMGRNLEDSYQQVAEAAECYIEADRLQIDDPIYRGRVNTCMGYICGRNNSDSLALIFYERAGKDFKKSNNKWRYAQNLLDRIKHNIDLHNYIVADSLLHIAQAYQLDSNYWARYLETKGCYFYEQQKYDSALVYFNQGLEYWQTKEDRCFSYLKIMQSYYFGYKDVDSTTHYAKLLISLSNKPNFLVNAYYCLMLDANTKNNSEQLSHYAHARADAQTLLRKNVSELAESTSILETYLSNPHPLRKIRVIIICSIVFCLFFSVGIIAYRKYIVMRMQSTETNLQVAQERIEDLSSRLEEQEAQKQTHYHDKNLAKILKKYPTPPNKWNEYSLLKKDVEPYLYNWLIALEQLGLTNREKVLCVFVFVYSTLPLSKVANYMNITENAARVLKTRVAQKLGVTSGMLYDYLRRMINAE